MKIGELIDQLMEIKAQYGDLQIYSEHDDDELNETLVTEIETVLVDDDNPFEAGKLAVFLYGAH